MTEINLPKIMSEILNVFASRYKNTDKSVIISIQILKMAQMLTNKRVKYKEFEKIDFPNYYTIVFLPSGGGKDRLSNEYDNFVFKQFRDWFKKMQKITILERNKKYTKNILIAKISK